MNIVIILGVLCALLYRRQFVGLIKHRGFLLIAASLLMLYTWRWIGYVPSLFLLLFILPLLNKLANYIEHKFGPAHSIPPPLDASEEMNIEEAREILEVSKTASRSEIIKAFKTQIKKNHPDHGGSAYFTKKITKARDKLLKNK